MELSGDITAPDGAASFMAAAVAELFRAAAAHEHAGRLDDAERVLKLILDAEPNQPDALHLAGVVAARGRRWPEALALMQRSLMHGVNTPLYLRNITEAYRVNGRLDDALTAGRRAVALNPDDPVVLSKSRGGACQQAGIGRGRGVRPCGLAAEPAARRRAFRAG